MIHVIDYYPPTPRPTALPQIYFEGNVYIVDFKLQQIRRVDGPQFTNFADLTNEQLKVQIRGVRAETSTLGYMKGLDD